MIFKLLHQYRIYHIFEPETFTFFIPTSFQMLVQWYAKRREEFRIKIQQIYDDCKQILGAAKIAAVMRNEGIRIGAEMVREVMCDMGLVSIQQESILHLY